MTVGHRGVSHHLTQKKRTGLASLKGPLLCWGKEKEKERTEKKGERREGTKALSNQEQTSS